MSYYGNQSPADWLYKMRDGLPLEVPNHQEMGSYGAGAFIYSREADVTPSYTVVTNYNVLGEQYEKNISLKQSHKIADSYAKLLQELYGGGGAFPEEALTYLRNLDDNVATLIDSIAFDPDKAQEVSDLISEYDTAAGELMGEFTPEDMPDFPEVTPDPAIAGSFTELFSILLGNPMIGPLIAISLASWFIIILLKRR
jgi:hypothetical protein